jgi:1-acyl-sn-glycerol-3-phosphate acyltransferase
MKADGAGTAQTRFRGVARPLSRRLWNFDLEGFDRIPAEGPAILAANHISFLDSMFLMTFVPRNISFVGKAEYMNSWKTKYLFPAMGMIPIDRAGGGRSQAALDTAERVLRRGELFGIFPEGTRSRDRRLHRGRTGAARLALTVGCPIVPVGIVGTADIQPPDSRFPSFGKPCTIKVGHPLRLDRYMRRMDDHRALRELTDEMMFEIRELTGQEYVNSYAGTVNDNETAKVASLDDARSRTHHLVAAGQ